MKMKKTLKVVASLLLVLVTSTFVFAQVSNTNFATAYTLRDDADNFMDVRYYNEVDFSNFFVWADFDDEANLGFAKKINELYLGTYYYGTLWAGVESKKETTATSSELEKNVSGNHYFDLLFGFSGMALKLDTYFSLDNENLSDSDTDFESETKTNGSYYMFGLTWGGLSVPAGNATLRPWARVGFNIQDSTVYTKTKLMDTTTETTNKSDNRNWLSLTLASDIEWGNKDSFFSVAGLDYRLYAAIGINGTVVEGTNNSVTRAGAQDICNIISPYYRFEYKASDKIKFGGYVGASVYFDTICEGYEYDIENPPTAIPELSVENYACVFSDLGLGMQYKVKPNFAMNFGFLAVLPALGSLKTVAPSILDGITTTVETDGGIFNPDLSMGFVWDINENCALDTALSIGINPSFLSSILDGSLFVGFKYKK